MAQTDIYELTTSLQALQIVPSAISEEFNLQFNEPSTVVLPVFSAGFNQKSPRGFGLEPLNGNVTDCCASSFLDNPAEDFSERYEILSTIGNGSFGTVFKAMRLETLEIVAVKYVFHVDEDQAGPQRELDILKSVQGCPMIVRLLDYFQTDRNYIYIMNLCWGSLDDIDVCDRTSDSIMKLFQDIQSAVSFLHEKMIVHRDLKPANILLSDDNTAMLADFGCARRVKAENNFEKLLTGSVGTYAYMAPEVVKNEARYSAIKADVWSLGCIIYFLLTGEDLYIGECVEFTILEHSATVAELPGNVEPTAITRSLEISMKSALQHNPRKRPIACML